MMEKRSKPPKQPSKLEVFFERPAVRIVAGLVAMALAYVFASWAIDSGSLLDYAIAFLFLFSGLRELIGGTMGALRNRRAR